MSEDTIAAVATAMSASGIGIVRISGPGAWETAGKVYRSRGGNKQLLRQKSHTIHYGYIYDGDVMADEVLVMLMRGRIRWRLTVMEESWRSGEYWRQFFTQEPDPRNQGNLPKGLF